MHFMAVSELKRPRRLRERLAQAGEIVVTNNGSPMALLLNVEKGEDPEDILRAARDARSALALHRVREAARRSEADRMSMGRVDDLIARVRSERKAAG